MVEQDLAFLTLPCEYEIVKERAGGMILTDCSERFHFTRQVDGSGEGGQVDEGVGENKSGGSVTVNRPAALWPHEGVKMAGDWRVLIAPCQHRCRRKAGEHEKESGI